MVTDSSIPHVSVIIPVFRVRNYIQRTIRSLLDQTLSNIEIILVDDGSPDDSVELARQVLENGHVPYSIIDQINQGVSVARNTGLAAATGEFVLFLDADDYLAPICLERLYVQAVGESADIAFAGFDFVREDERILVEYNKLFRYIVGTRPGPEVLEQDLLDTTRLWLGCTLFRRHFLQEYRFLFRPRCRYGEDREFIGKALWHARTVTAVSETLAYYVQRPGSAVHGADTRMFDVLAAQRRLRQYIAKGGDSLPLSEALQKYAGPLTTLEIVFAMARRCCPYPEILKVLHNPKIRHQLLAVPWRRVDRWYIAKWLLAQGFLYAPYTSVKLWQIARRASHLLRLR